MWYIQVPFLTLDYPIFFLKYYCIFQVTQKSVPAKTVVSAVGAVGNVSLHSSNDSGFSNEPPPQPDVDYSDEEAQRHRIPIR